MENLEDSFNNDEYKVGKPVEPKPQITEVVREFFKERWKHLLIATVVGPIIVYSGFHGFTTLAALKAGKTKTEIEQRFSDIYEKKYLGDLQNLIGKPGRETMYLLLGTNE